MRSRPKVIALTFLCFATSFEVLAAAEVVPETDEQRDEWHARIKREVYAGISKDEEFPFVKLAEPKAGEWRSIHKESPQTFENYTVAFKVRPTEKRKVIVLQPLGEMTAEHKRVLEALREFTAIFFQSPVRVAEVLPLADTKGNQKLDRPVWMGQRHGTYERQFSAEKIMDRILIPKLPDDAVVYLGITLEDLWVADLSYVFGLGSKKERVGVYSLARFFPEFWGDTRKDGDELLALRRACKILNHETGHMFGLQHCVFYRCSMNGCNNLEELDGAPMEYCPVCHKKLHWNLGFDPALRFQKLKEFYARQKLEPEAKWVEQQIDGLKRQKEAAAARKIVDE
jgi:archaemetzincin